MNASARYVAMALVAALIAFTGGCGTPTTPDALMARAPDNLRLAVATVGARNIRVLYVSGPSIVRLREVFVPEGEAITAIAWSDNGRDLIVTTSGQTFAVDTRTWRIEWGMAQARRVASDPGETDG